jgi:glycogen debranching enzyme
LPEFIAGTQRLPGDAPSHTPRADPLQAWSAAAVPFMVSELLGLQADGFAKRLRVHNPLLPDGVDTLAVHDLRVGDARVSLSFSRQPDGASMQVIANESGIEVAIS